MFVLKVFLCASVKVYSIINNNWSVRDLRTYVYAKTCDNDGFSLANYITSRIQQAFHPQIYLLLYTALLYMYYFLFLHLVLRIQFASATFSGLESSGEIIVSIIITGGIPATSIFVNVSFSEATATG